MINKDHTAETQEKRTRVIRFADDKDDEAEMSVEDVNVQSKAADSRKDKDAENDSSAINAVTPQSAPKPTTLQQKMLAMAGQDIDQFMREVRQKNYLLLCVLFV